MMLSRVCLDSGAVARAPRRPRVVMAKHAKSAVRLRKATHSPSHVARGDPTPPDDRPPALVPALAALVVAATALGNLPLVAPPSAHAEQTLVGPGASTATASSSQGFAEQTRAAPPASSPALRRSSAAARQAARETRSAEALLATAAAKKREAAAEVAKATVAETGARRAEQAAMRKLRNAKWLADTTTAASAATGVLVVSVAGSIWRSGGGSILVAGAIRNTLEGAAATKTVYAVRWDDPFASPASPDGLPATLSLKARGVCDVDVLRRAIAEANGLACGPTEVAHVAHYDPTTRFLRPLRTAEETRVTPDGAWVLWSRRESIQRGTCDVVHPSESEPGWRHDATERTPYPFPAMLPYPFEDPRVRDGTRANGRMGGWGGDGA